MLDTPAYAFIRGNCEYEMSTKNFNVYDQKKSSAGPFILSLLDVACLLLVASLFMLILLFLTYSLFNGVVLFLHKPR